MTSRVILMLSSDQAWWLYHLLRFVPGGTARTLRQSLGDLLEKMKELQ